MARRRRTVTDQSSAESSKGQTRPWTLTAWMAITFVCVTVFLVGLRLTTGHDGFPDTTAIGAWFIVRKHPKMFLTVGPEPQPKELL